MITTVKDAEWVKEGFERSLTPLCQIHNDRLLQILNGRKSSEPKASAGITLRPPEQHMSLTFSCGSCPARQTGYLRQLCVCQEVIFHVAIDDIGHTGTSRILKYIHE